MINPVRPDCNPVHLMWMEEQDRKERIDNAIADIRSGPHNHDWIVQVLASYKLSEQTLSDAECSYINKMINI